MHSFTDSRGRTWQVEFDDDTVRRLRSQLGITPPELYAYAQRGGGTLHALNLMMVLITPQLVEQDVSPQDFADAMPDECAAGAARAAVRALNDWTKDGLARIAAPSN